MKKIWERIVPISKADRNFDIQFWQAQSPTTRFRAAFNMIEDYYRMRGKKITSDSFRLRKDVERLKINKFAK